MFRDIACDDWSWAFQVNEVTAVMMTWCIWELLLDLKIWITVLVVSATHIRPRIQGCLYGQSCANFRHRNFYKYQRPGSTVIILFHSFISTRPIAALGSNSVSIFHDQIQHVFSISYLLQRASAFTFLQQLSRSVCLHLFFSVLLLPCPLHITYWPRYACSPSCIVGTFAVLKRYFTNYIFQCGSSLFNATCFTYCFSAIRSFTTECSIIRTRSVRKSNCLL